MSRVYNVMTGAGYPAGPGTSGIPGTIAVADDDGWEDGEDAPFIEIGGPGGPVFSALPPVAGLDVTPPPVGSLTEVKPEVKPEPQPEPAARPYPRLAPPPGAPAYLSVRFHDI